MRPLVTRTRSLDGGVELGELGEKFRGEVGGIIWRLLKSGADGGTLG